ncbi:ribonuclease H, partial [Trifolium pratense]
GSMLTHELNKCAEELPHWSENNCYRYEAGCAWLDSGVFPPNLNSTNIALIPKAFVPRRSILDNAMAAIEIIHYMKSKTRGKKGEAALKLDISKAYDRID